MVIMSRRERLHAEMKEEIKTIARRQMAVEGNEALSLRAIARQMEVTAPALYRYFASRDELITALIVDAFNGLADALEGADAASCRSDGTAAYGARLLSVMLAYRDWALTHPTDFALIYGTPIPGYQAPTEITAAAAARSMTTPLAILAAAFQAGVLHIPAELQTVPLTVVSALEAVSTKWHTATAIQPYYIGVIGWTRCHGMIMLELFHHTQPVVGDTAALYRAELIAFLTRLGLSP